jgi:hypothetical protein
VRSHAGKIISDKRSRKNSWASMGSSSYYH